MTRTDAELELLLRETFQSREALAAGLAVHGPPRPTHRAPALAAAVAAAVVAGAVGVGGYLTTRPVGDEPGPAPRSSAATTPSPTPRERVTDADNRARAAASRRPSWPGCRALRAHARCRSVGRSIRWTPGRCGGPAGCSPPGRGPGVVGDPVLRGGRGAR
ncbi:MAG: hypothetical protein R2734_16800 [Nocardioides sp.]